MKVIQRYIGRRWNLPEIDSMCEATLITSDFEDKVSHRRKNGEILQDYDVIEKKKLRIK